MAELKRRTLTLSSDKQIKLFGNSIAIGKSLEIGEGYAPNIFSCVEGQPDGKTTASISNPHKLTREELMELADYNIQFLPELFCSSKSNTMNETMSNGKMITPILFPYDPEQFWQSIRQIVREEINNAEKQKPVAPTFETPGMTYKPLYKIAEVCAIFHVTKPTIYDWIKHGKLKPYKIRSRVFFLWQDIQKLIQPSEDK